MPIGRYDINFFDLGGEKSIRDIWKSYNAEAHGIVFVLDSTRPFRLLEAKSALQELLNDDNLKNKPILM